MDPLLWLKYKKEVLHIISQHVDYLFIPSFFYKNVILVVDFVVKIHIILKLYVALPFYILSEIVDPNSYFKRNVFGTAFCEIVISLVINEQDYVLEMG